MPAGVDKPPFPRWNQLVRDSNHLSQMFTDSASSAWRSSARHRVAYALVLVALLLFGSLARTLHEATTTHAICPEHGELLDVQGGPFDAILSAQLAASLAHEDPSRRCDPHALPSEWRHSHDECWFETLSRPGSSYWVDSSPRLVPLTLDASNSVVRTCVRVAAIPTLSFAPKHSPPARAA